MIIEVNEITALFDEFYLIEETPSLVVKEKENPIKIHFEGGNAKGLVMLFGHVLSAEDSDMIHKLIHNALKIKMEDVALVHLPALTGLKMEQVIDIIKPKHLILWGNNPIFPSNETKYKVGKIGQVSYINVDEVSRFHSDITLKTSLWNSIQQLLNG